MESEKHSGCDNRKDKNDHINDLIEKVYFDCIYHIIFGNPEKDVKNNDDLIEFFVDDQFDRNMGRKDM